LSLLRTPLPHQVQIKEQVKIVFLNLHIKKEITV